MVSGLDEMVCCVVVGWCLVFFFNDTATTEIYTLSLHDALPIWSVPVLGWVRVMGSVQMLG